MNEQKFSTRAREPKHVNRALIEPNDEIDGTPFPWKKTFDSTGMGYGNPQTRVKYPEI